MIGRGRSDGTRTGLRQQAVAYWRAREPTGDGVRAVATALGVAPVSLRRWAQDAPVPARRTSIADAAPARPRLVVVVDATGVRVEGVDRRDGGAVDRATAMRWAGRRVAVYAHGAPTDMRKGFDSLCGMVTERLARNPLSGDVFFFVSRDRIRAKVLHFDGTGLCLYVKRLERGRFAALWRDEAAGPMTLTVSELDLFLDGSALVGRMPLTPPALTQFSLASDRA